MEDGPALTMTLLMGDIGALASEVLPDNKPLGALEIVHGPVALNVTLLPLPLALLELLLLLVKFAVAAAMAAATFRGETIIGARTDGVLVVLVVVWVEAPDTEAGHLLLSSRHVEPKEPNIMSQVKKNIHLLHDDQVIKSQKVNELTSRNHFTYNMVK